MGTAAGNGFEISGRCFGVAAPPLDDNARILTVVWSVIEVSPLGDHTRSLTAVRAQGQLCRYHLCTKMHLDKSLEMSLQVQGPTLAAIR